MVSFSTVVTSADKVIRTSQISLKLCAQSKLSDQIRNELIVKITDFCESSTTFDWCSAFNFDLSCFCFIFFCGEPVANCTVGSATLMGLIFQFCLFFATEATIIFFTALGGGTNVLGDSVCTSCAIKKCALNRKAPTCHLRISSQQPKIQTMVSGEETLLFTPEMTVSFLFFFSFRLSLFVQTETLSACCFVTFTMSCTSSKLLECIC